MDRRAHLEDPLIVRVADPEDTVRINALFQASYPVLWNGVYERSVLDVVLPLFCRAQPQLLEAGTFFLAEDRASGRVLGVGGWHRQRSGSPESVPGEGHVRHFAVHPSAVRRGVGRAIMNAVLDSSAAEGVETLHCTSSLTAGAYYTAFGFRETGRITLPVAGVEFPVIEMRRDA